LRGPNMDKISIGMDKPTVIAALGKKPDAIVGAKKYDNGTVEVLQYLVSVDAAGHPNYSWLYFYNDKLVQFGKRDGDWQYTADNIAQDNSRK
jgi:hypothetical protein